MRRKYLIIMFSIIYFFTYYYKACTPTHICVSVYLICRRWRRVVCIERRRRWLGKSIVFIRSEKPSEKLLLALFHQGRIVFARGCHSPLIIRVQIPYGNGSKWPCRPTAPALLRTNERNVKSSGCGEMRIY
jgi:hypothetical protein